LCDKCDKANISRSSSYLSLSLLFLPACYVVLYRFTSEISSFMGANLSKTLGVFLASNSIFLTSWAILSSGLGKIFGNKEMRLLMLGLDAAGKTSKPPPFVLHFDWAHPRLSYPLQTQVEPICDYHSHRCVRCIERVLSSVIDLFSCV